MRVGHARYKLLDGAAGGSFDARAAAIVVFLKQALHLNEITASVCAELEQIHRAHCVLVSSPQSSSGSSSTAAGLTAPAGKPGA